MDESVRSFIGDEQMRIHGHPPGRQRGVSYASAGRPRRRVIIVHASDIHFGKPHLPELSEALVRFVHDLGPGAVVISGDLTQRAKAAEYRAARAFLDSLAPYPVIATAGNHDVPLYRFWERVLAPRRNYRSVIGAAPDTVLDADPGPGAPGGVRFVALDSSSPLRAIVNGRVTARQLEFADRFFGAAPAGALRVLVVHHNLVDPGDGPKAPPLRGAARILDRLPCWGVGLVLAGHVHRSHLGHGGGDGREGADADVPLILAGTASSNRGRGRERGRNSFNLIRVEESGIEATVYLYSRSAGRFQPAESRRYPGAFR